MPAKSGTSCLGLRVARRHRRPAAPRSRLPAPRHRRRLRQSLLARAPRRSPPPAAPSAARPVQRSASIITSCRRRARPPSSRRCAPCGSSTITNSTSRGSSAGREAHERRHPLGRSNSAASPGRPSAPFPSCRRRCSPVRGNFSAVPPFCVTPRRCARIVSASSGDRSRAAPVDLRLLHRLPLGSTARAASRAAGADAAVGDRRVRRRDLQRRHRHALPERHGRGLDRPHPLAPSESARRARPADRRRSAARSRSAGASRAARRAPRARRSWRCRCSTTWPAPRRRHVADRLGVVDGDLATDTLVPVLAVTNSRRRGRRPPRARPRCVKVFIVEPGSNGSVTARLRAPRSRAPSGSLGLSDGTAAIASTSPLFGSIATATPALAWCAVTPFVQRLLEAELDVAIDGRVEVVPRDVGGRRRSPPTSTVAPERVAHARHLRARAAQLALVLQLDALLPDARRAPPSRAAARPARGSGSSDAARGRGTRPAAAASRTARASSGDMRRLTQVK